MTPSAARIVCIGAITVDYTLLLHDAPVSGTSNPASRSRAGGGVAHNVACNLSKLDCAVSLVSVVGDDNEGRALIDGVRRHGIDTTHVALVPGKSSGSYTAILQPHGELHIGVSDLSICDAMDSQFLIAQWPALPAADFVFADTNLPMDSLAELVARCRAESRTLCVDAVSVAKARRLPASLDGIDTLFANSDEAAVIAGSALGDPGMLANAICERGARTAIVTRGAAGLWWSSAGRQGHCPALPVAVRDVSGAGDALIAAFIAGKLRGQSLLECLRMGLHAAAATVESPGPLSSQVALSSIADAMPAGKNPGDTACN
jgi:pseudouridine kinase